MKSEQLMLKIQMKNKHAHIFQKMPFGYHNNWHISWSIRFIWKNWNGHLSTRGLNCTFFILWFMTTTAMITWMKSFNWLIFIIIYQILCYKHQYTIKSCISIHRSNLYIIFNYHQNIICILHLYLSPLSTISINDHCNSPIQIGLSCCFNVFFNSDDDDKILFAASISRLSWPWTKVEVKRITKVIQR